jgi:ankyrin repeat protein
MKWAQAYYFKHYDIAVFLMEHGMSPELMSWHQVRILHDMAQKAEIKKAALLIKYGAALNELEDEYQSTPLGMASRWGHTNMVEYLLEQGADPNKAGASWSTPMAWAQIKGHSGIVDMLRSAGAR